MLKGANRRPDNSTAIHTSTRVPCPGRKQLHPQRLWEETKPGSESKRVYPPRSVERLQTWRSCLSLNNILLNHYKRIRCSLWLYSKSFCIERCTRGRKEFHRSLKSCSHTVVLRFISVNIIQRATHVAIVVGRGSEYTVSNMIISLISQGGETLFIGACRPGKSEADDAPRSISVNLCSSMRRLSRVTTATPWSTINPDDRLPIAVMATMEAAAKPFTV